MSSAKSSPPTVSSSSSLPSGDGPQFQIQLAAFSDPNFKVQRIIDVITYRPLSSSKIHPSADNASLFDVRPFAKLFGATLEDLIRMRKRVQREIGDLEDQLSAQDSISKSKLVELGHEFSKLHGTFDTLESRVSEVGTTAVRIGEQLETIDKQRSKAADVRELLEYFLDLNKGVLDRLNNLTTTPQGQLRASVLSRRLQYILRDIDGAPTDTARVAIDQFCEQFESNLLRAFDKAAEVRDIPTLKHITSVLVEYNGGETAIRTWINRHPIFNTPISNTGVGNRSRDNSNVSGEPGLRRLFDQLRATVYQDWDVLSQVFTHPLSVLSQLIQRYFQQVIQVHLESMLRETMQSNLQYLKVLANADSAGKQLIKDMAHFDSTILQRTGSISRIVEQAMDEQFTPFRSTFDREVTHFLAIVQEIFKDALSYYAARKQQKKSMFSRIQKGTGTASLEHHLSTDHVIKVLEAHTDAINRCLQLYSDPAPIIAKLYTILCQQVYVRYMEVALEAVWEETMTMDGSRTEPDFKILTTVQSTNLLVQLMQAHFETGIAPILVFSPDIHRSSVGEKNKIVSRLELRTSVICEHFLACTVAHIQSILSKQKKTDFRTKGEDAMEVAHQLASPVCVSICEFLQRIHAHMTDYLDGINYHTFVLELGMHLNAQLLEHFKKFPVSTTGALTLSRDVAKYQQSISVFQVQELVHRFDLLRELGHLFLVRPENLPSILCEGFLAQLDSITLQEYLSNRVDYKSAHIESMLHDRGTTGLGLTDNAKAREGSSMLTLSSSTNTHGEGNVSISSF